ncbi:MAG: hypothetical protein MUC50_09200 [Myxococcota bacterium]|nr:hypothetical protein [Myxococcota bacterium]
MSSKADNDDLCSTCSKAQGCRLRPDRGRIVCCDEYEGPQRNATAIGESLLCAGPKASPPPSSKGLCPTCALKTMCARRDETFGVWRCKDYR